MNSMVIIRWEGRPQWWSGKHWGRRDDAVEYTSEYAQEIMHKRWGGGIKEGKSINGIMHRVVTGEAVMEAI